MAGQGPCPGGWLRVVPPLRAGEGRRPSSLPARRSRRRGSRAGRAVRKGLRKASTGAAPGRGVITRVLFRITECFIMIFRKSFRGCQPRLKNSDGASRRSFGIARPAETAGRSGAGRGLSHRLAAPERDSGRCPGHGRRRFPGRRSRPRLAGEECEERLSRRRAGQENLRVTRGAAPRDVHSHEVQIDAAKYIKLFQ